MSAAVKQQHAIKEDLGNTSEKIDKSIADLAVTHHKSIQHVQKELHMG